MIISKPDSPLLNSNPSQPSLPGLEPNVVARYEYNRGEGPTGPVKIRVDRPIDAPSFDAFNDAASAARDIMTSDRKDARWGLFKRHAGRVDSIALLQAKDGIRLARTTLAIDRWVEPVPGQMFPGQNWTMGPPEKTIRETPATLALIGADTIIDLRSGDVEGPVNLPKRPKG